MGGENTQHEVAAVLPGALVPALLEDHGPAGRLFSAQDFKCLECRPKCPTEVNQSGSE
jgi:hypothetical protein